MKKSTILITAIACAAAITGALIVVTQFPPLRNDERAAQSAATALPSTAEPSPTPWSATPATDEPVTDKPGTQEPPPEGSPPVPGERYSTEVLPPSADQDDKRLPPSKPLPELLALPLPPTASAIGEVVDGFPSAILPGAPDSFIDGTSVATEGPRMQAALEGRTSLAVGDVQAFYRSSLAPLGLLETTVTPGEPTALTFTRDENTVTLTVSSVAGGSHYVLFGVFTAKE